MERVRDVRWLTVEEVADRLKKHPQTVREMLRDGALPGHKTHERGTWRVDAADLVQWMRGIQGRYQVRVFDDVENTVIQCAMFELEGIYTPVPLDADTDALQVQFRRLGAYINATDNDVSAGPGGDRDAAIVPNYYALFAMTGLELLKRGAI